MHMPCSFRTRCLSGLTLALLLPFSVAAQESRNGPKIGFDISCQTAGKFLGWNGQPKFGFLAGWSFEVPVTSQVSVLLEPMYIMKGSRTVDSYNKIRSNTTLNYIEMPVMLKVSTNPDPQGLFVTVGLMYGYFLGGETKTNNNGEVTRSSFSYAGTKAAKRSQWSAALGIGHEMGHWMWELRGQNSLNTFQATLSAHNVVYSLQVAWRFASYTDREKKRSAQEDED